MPASASDWLDERRKAALEAYEGEPVPTWRRSGFWTTTLRKLDLDALEPRRYEPVSSVDELPAVVGEALDDEPGALIVQRGASTVLAQVSSELTEQGVVVMPLEQAVVEHEELVRDWYMKRLSETEGKFPAATAAFWTGGVFIHVPRNAQVKQPIQTVYVIDEPGTAQYAHTLAIVEENADCAIREYCLGGDFEGQALHAGGFELYARPGLASSSRTSTTGAAARSTTSRRSASRSPATPSSAGCRSTSAGA